MFKMFATVRLLSSGASQVKIDIANLLYNDDPLELCASFLEQHYPDFFSSGETSNINTLIEWAQSNRLSSLAISPVGGVLLIGPFKGEISSVHAHWILDQATRELFDIFSSPQTAKQGMTNL